MDLQHADIFAECHRSSDFILSKLPSSLQQPKIAIICGTGLGGLVDSVQFRDRHEFSFSDIPNIPAPTVEGHPGKFIFGLIDQINVPILFMVGRLHFYEGLSMKQITYPTRLFKILGIQTVIVTNAAGGLNAEYKVGDIVVIHDHINLPGLSGSHPLRGPNDDRFGPRFPALSDAYNLNLRRTAHNAWKGMETKQRKRMLREGVYGFVAGPSFETRAECRFLRIIGADLVGMSTVPEVIVARHCGLQVLALSLVTNMSVLEPGLRGDSDEIAQISAEDASKLLEKGKATLEEVLESGKEASKDMQELIVEILRQLTASR